MASRKDLKLKRKAADRRRARRQAAHEQTEARPGPATSSPQVDVLDLIATTILDCADNRSHPLVDATVVSALRSCLQGTEPESESSQHLAQQLDQIAQREHVDRSSLRRNLKEVLQTASEYRSPTRADAFIDYLRLLSS